MDTVGTAHKPSPFDLNAQFALAVDDDMGRRCALKSCLELMGYVVLTASNGAEATELAPLFPFAVVVTADKPPPHLHDVTCQIRALGGHFRHIPILSLPVHSDPVLN